MTTDDKANNGGTEPRPANRARQASRQGPRPVEPRPLRYMVAALSQSHLDAMGIGVRALDAEGLRLLLDNDPEVVVHRVLAASRAEPPRQGEPGPASPGSVAFPPVVVAEMTAEHATGLRARLPQVHIERDRSLVHCEAQVPPRKRKTAPSAAPPPGVESTFTFLVKGSGGTPLPGAVVSLTGSCVPGHAVTGPDGRATVTMAGETPETIAEVVVTPRSGHWSARVERPALSTSRDNLIELTGLAETVDGFPGRQTLGWGQRAMGLDRLPKGFKGAGVTVAIIDSGAAIDHPDLRGRITSGIDLVGERAAGWADDVSGHGSHCAGVIAAADDGVGIAGFVPGAAVHVCKIFPGGRFSDLVEALGHCIDDQVDVVALGLGSRHSSPLVAAKIDQARAAGVACVVAAGNDGGPVAFPGNLPTVLTVAAVGKIGTFPETSGHAAGIQGPLTPEGYFSPRFTCHGPEVDVCAPGVAVLSCAPPRDYAAADGTSAAVPHVAGLAALVLAHHDDFRHGYGRRDASRVDRLFQIIRSSCVPIDLGDPWRTGAGLPDVLQALGTSITGTAGGAATAWALSDRLADELAAAGLSVPTPVPAPGLHAEAVTAPGDGLAGTALAGEAPGHPNGSAPGHPSAEGQMSLDDLIGANGQAGAWRPNGPAPAGADVMPAGGSENGPVSAAGPARTPGRARTAKQNAAASPIGDRAHGGVHADGMPPAAGLPCGMPGMPAAWGAQGVPMGQEPLDGVSGMGGVAGTAGTAVPDHDGAGGLTAVAAFAWLAREMGAAGLAAGQRADDLLD
ncbi:hypothetical protein Pth03_79940 [Planotetraspora thailandica]|uniref:Peptidase S8/S53 domain-containing protein n=1 Tax=Planotetraspora thailandica TaxID=487172 RepID=A0A8J3Y2Q5_9ACTN|nr:S8 family serine peptidase [Planotetraspora thailandica]GII59605.1 hypothetical protein Pth03_79940 [Planotetraspora thailandica]